ncbi:ABC transporter ATP-binding protein [Microbacterium sp. zg.Y1090]|uniref:ABC transporter ATP-binding protein n=1 Tax=Microbacterium TaxID=33882 RepID=UPI00214C1C8D|nr:MULTISPECIES: ABC transporter ATP-binding protein [unclassified Microbacterium]MCR2814013.1 ABC transporter ATP-binding protein [Microbacterium sp. zg.Y1084]MCR2819287.1 ABC transporter ATP-binding protein [Microbacterium sp. zg.Y1090]MDL5487204.1 ABC transporter ATP-binding protein [Microbacterium sp. zg-Y1211]WIM28269.1 ABC transporter ATP-binding protein [Microbacterium sp. zg-Y1090]
MLSVTHLQKIYGSGPTAFEALRDVDFSVRQGEFVCLVGPSGSGKTTLLKNMAGLMTPTAGEVVVDGRRVAGPPKGLALVFQEYGRSLFPWLKVGQNVELPLKELRLSAAERRQRVRDALEHVGLGANADSYPWQMSGGMQQRAAIARAIAYQPKVLLMDEPFAAVDAQTRADLEDLIRRIWDELGITTLFVTHDIDEAVYLAERVIVLSSSPTFVQREMIVDLPRERDQLTTRSLPRFAELRHDLYAEIQRAKVTTAPAV